MSVAIPDNVYRCPQNLKVAAVPLRRVIVIGQCLMEGWPAFIQDATDGCPCDFYLFNKAQEIPATPPHPVGEYDFQLIHIPLRSVVPEGAYMRLRYNDTAAYERLFEESRQRLLQFLEGAMRWNRDHGLLTFVVNFLLPQQNPMGRLLPRYDLRNFVYFVERLNQALAEELTRYQNAYLFDLDQIVSTYGRRYFQDDVVFQMNHNSALANEPLELDQDRLEPVETTSVYYSIRLWDYLIYGWAELVAMYRTVRQADAVKLVVMDLDDTLWRGIAAEKGRDGLAPHMTEGWPLGLAEALGYLKRRGILLGILSKNDEANITEIWKPLWGNRLALDDFAVRKINWRTKVENFEEILHETNLLAKNVVFVDDNPVERAAIQGAFPGVRVLGGAPALWRRVLLWSSETQVSSITSESAVRTEMVQAQVEREGQRARLSRSEFLTSLQLEVNLSEIDQADHASFPRMFELLNKSNQFNTTGKRWTREEGLAALAAGSRFFVFDAKDVYTAYGIVGVVIVEDTNIAQFVMSCRVVGMEVEIAVIAELLRLIRGRAVEQVVTASLEKTPLNLLARDLYERCGFTPDDEHWARSFTPYPETPAHILFSAHGVRHPSPVVAEAALTPL